MTTMTASFADQYKAELLKAIDSIDSVKSCQAGVQHAAPLQIQITNVPRTLEGLR